MGTDFAKLERMYDAYEKSKWHFLDCPPIIEGKKDIMISPKDESNTLCAVFDDSGIMDNVIDMRSKSIIKLEKGLYINNRRYEYECRFVKYKGVVLDMLKPDDILRIHFNAIDFNNGGGLPIWFIDEHKNECQDDEEDLSPVAELWDDTDVHNSIMNAFETKGEQEAKVVARERMVKFCRDKGLSYSEKAIESEISFVIFSLQNNLDNLIDEFVDSIQFEVEESNYEDYLKEERYISQFLLKKALDTFESEIALPLSFVAANACISKRQNPGERLVSHIASLGEKEYAQYLNDNLSKMCDYWSGDAISYGEELRAWALNSREYNWLCRFLPDDVPKSKAAYTRMKQSRSFKYYSLRKKALEFGYELIDDLMDYDDIDGIEQEKNKSNNYSFDESNSIEIYYNYFDCHYAPSYFHNEKEINKLVALQNKYREAFENHRCNERKVLYLYEIATDKSFKRMDMVDEAYQNVLDDLNHFYPIWVEFHNGVKDVLTEAKYYIDKTIFGGGSTYCLHKKMAIILDNVGDYEKEIELCKMALSVGADMDCTKGGMKARLERAQKKQAKELKPQNNSKRIDRDEVVVNAIHNRCPVSHIKNDKHLFFDGYKCFEKGSEFLNDGNEKEAVQLFDKAREAGINTYELYILYARAFRKLRDYDNEIIIIEEYIGRNPNSHTVEMMARRDRAVELLYKQQNYKREMESRAIRRAQIAEQSKLKKERLKAIKESEPKINYRRAILQMDDNGNIIAEYESVADAVRAVGINKKSIRNAADGTQRHAAGYVWKYKESNEQWVEKKTQLEEHKRMMREQYEAVKESGPKVEYKRAVLQMDDEGNVIAEYESIADAVRAVGVSKNCIRDTADGKQKHAGGYVWKYKK